MAQPDLKTKEGALQFLDYHSPDKNAQSKHKSVNYEFQELLDNLWDVLPDGPGKTIFVRKLGDARMSANSCIANEGA